MEEEHLNWALKIFDRYRWERGLPGKGKRMNKSSGYIQGAISSQSIIARAEGNAQEERRVASRRKVDQEQK